jgi:hypothetical protein
MTDLDWAVVLSFAGIIGLLTLLALGELLAGYTVHRAVTEALDEQFDGETEQAITEAIALTGQPAWLGVLDELAARREQR